MKSTLCSVAIVDDHSVVRGMANRFLTQHGFSVCFEAENGKDLLVRLLTQNPLPDICLLDLNMPVMDGYETIKKLRQYYPTVKILVFTLFPKQYEKDDVLQLGAHGFIPKESDPVYWKEALVSICSMCKE